MLCVALVKYGLQLIISSLKKVLLQGVVRGGIDVNGEFQYFVEPSGCLQGVTESSCTSASIMACLQLHHGFPSYVNIVPWYEHRTWVSAW